MDIISTILPVYDAVAKQERYKGYDHITRVCDRNALLPFLCKRTHSATNDTLTSIKLVDCAGTETEIAHYLGGVRYPISSWTNYSASYETFTSIAGVISASINSSASGVAYSNTFSVTSGKFYVLYITLTLNSGQAPSVAISDTITLKSNQVALVNGVNTVILRATATGTYSLHVSNTSNTNFSLTLPDIRLMNLGYYNYTSVDYFQYNGQYLNTSLPGGRYYLKMTDGINYFYSEYFDVDDIYTNQVTSWSASGTYPPETLTSSGATIQSFVNTVGDGRAYSNSITIANGEILKVVFNLTLNSGTLPTCAGYETPGAADVVTGEGTCTEGLNEFTFVCTKSTNLLIGFNVTGAATNFSTGPVYVYRTGADYHSKVEFTNTLDLGDILYQHAFSQEFFALSQVKEIDATVTTEADIRDGVDIKEKITTAPKYRIIAACSPMLAQCLKSLPQHTTVNITAPNGITYGANNIEVENSEEFYDITKVSINFTDNEMVWTRNQNNIT